MKLTLHIGATKTGSTSIQEVMALNRTLLQSHGILYPLSLGKDTHNKIPVYLQGKFRGNELERKVGVYTESEYKEFLANAPRDFKKEVDLHAPQHIIISSEHLQSRLTETIQFDRLKSILAPALIAKDQEIVLYLRPQMEHLMSLYSTMLRHGIRQSIDEFIASYLQEPARQYFDYESLIQRWTRAFPNVRLLVRPYSNVRKLTHGAVSDFTEVTGLSHLDSALKYLDRRNESMGAWGCEALLQLNNDASNLPDPARRAISRWIRAEVRGGGHPKYEKELARKFQASFEKGNAWIIENYLPQAPAALSPNWEALEVNEPPSAVTAKQVMALIRKLSTLMTQDQQKT